MAALARSRRGGPICRGGSCLSLRSAGRDRWRGGGCCWRVVSGCGRVVRGGVEPPKKTEVIVSGQLALVIEEETVVPAAVWETLPLERQLQVAVRLARLLARIVEAARDE
jgi:hypothetical protein